MVVRLIVAHELIRFGRCHGQYVQNVFSGKGRGRLGSCVSYSCEQRSGRHQIDEEISGYEDSSEGMQPRNMYIRAYIHISIDESYRWCTCPRVGSERRVQERFENPRDIAALMNEGSSRYSVDKLHTIPALSRTLAV